MQKTEGRTTKEPLLKYNKIFLKKSHKKTHNNETQETSARRTIKETYENKKERNNNKNINETQTQSEHEKENTNNNENKNKKRNINNK